jgi:hypothetical protein
MVQAVKNLIHYNVLERATCIFTRIIASKNVSEEIQENASAILVPHLTV